MNFDYLMFVKQALRQSGPMESLRASLMRDRRDPPTLDEDSHSQMW